MNMKFREFVTGLIFVYFMSCPGAIAFELDLSVDEEIRAKYNSTKLEDEMLQDLPPILKDTGSNSVQTPSVAPAVQVYPKIDVPSVNITTDFSDHRGGVEKTMEKSFGNEKYTEIKVKKGTKFKVKSLTRVSDANGAGARMSFSTTELVTKRYVTFPVGTTFKGVVEDSHGPQITGNGGLVKVKADTLVCKGHARQVNAKVVKVNDKRVYFNNIKGKRGYWSGVGKQVAKGEKFYLNSKKVSSRLSNNPFGAVISPIPTLVGSVGYTGNLLLSPIVGILSKGGHAVLPAGSTYTLKLKEDLILY